MANKTWIISGAVAVAAVVAFVALRGPNPGSEGTPGAIGTANRYQSEQMGSGDVTLDDAQVATFIQSDVFRKLATDEAFREAARAESFNHFLANAALREASAKYDMARLMSDASFRDLLRTEAFARALDQAKLGEAIRYTDLAKLTEAGRLTDLLRSEPLRELAMREDFQRFADAAARAQVTSVEALGRVEGIDAMRKLDSFRALESNAKFQEAMKSGFLSMFRTTDLAKFSTENLRDLAGMRAFTDAARIEGFAKLAGAMRVEDLAMVQDVAARAEVMAVFASEAYREAALRDELGRIAAVNMREALARVEAVE